MFEIRVICDPADTERVTTALNGMFATGAVRQYPTRDGERTRLYFTADHRPELGPWPTPEEAYVLAPSMVSEIGWTAQTAADKPFGEDLDREYWLRKAALLDRIALQGETDGFHGDACEAATEAALQLVAFDLAGEGDYFGAPYWPDCPTTAAEPRGYVRQEYAYWVKNH
ncbi:hypothetical protein ACFOZ0_32385 [Streptomyces yaanensis]|uniref:Uncharacterized protein n=1 Tax=Streptomyces yaanensis TaxID=1142239 RepID=A0ABV7SP29_9ACTN|nr:hypothetical protein [Streptomyces sp. CGMCC 4.7035]WNC02152.1 hypothetical protein Q2K21_31100 [Streptomyces sp. CGMCC 4.7035]